MYDFILEKKDVFLGGRTIKYIAEKVGINKDYLSTILSGKKSCSKPIAYCLAKVASPDYEIEDFFKRKEQ